MEEHENFNIELQRSGGVAIAILGDCLESVDWTTGLEYWTEVLEWPKLL